MVRATALVAIHGTDGSMIYSFPAFKRQGFDAFASANSDQVQLRGHVRQNGPPNAEKNFKSTYLGVFRSQESRSQLPVPMSIAVHKEGIL